MTIEFSTHNVSCSGSECDSAIFSIQYISVRDGKIEPFFANCNVCDKPTRSKVVIKRLEDKAIMDFGEIPSARGKTAEAVRRMMRKCIFELQG